MACAIAAPLIIINAQFNVKFSQGMSEGEGTSFSEANRIAADCIQNFKTVATLANERKFVSDYEQSMRRPLQRFARRVHVQGVLYGMSQFIEFGVIGGLFYAGAFFHIEHGGRAQDIFIAIFAMVFGAMSCGQA